MQEAGLETEGMVESTAKLRDEILAVAGVDILDSTGRNFKSTYQIMSELAKVWGQLDGLAKQGLLEKIAGKRGAVAVGAALQNWNIAEQARDLALNGGGSMDEQLAVYNQSIQASLDKFKVAFQELSTDLINSDTIKGVVDFGTAIIKLIDTLVEHIGVLGTALTGLGIAKIFSTAASGAKSVEGLAPAISLFNEALSTGVGKGEAFGLVLEQLGVKAAGAGSALGTMFSTLGGFIASPAGLVTGVVAAVAAAGAIAYNIRKKQQEELRKQATEATEKWTNDKSSIDEYKAQYTELNDQLKNANLTESERIGIKQQLLDLQNQINEKYGADVSNLDLINGEYETQLNLISQIAEKEAHRSLQNNREAYQQSVDEMTKDRDYTMYSNGSNSNLMKQIEWAYIRSGFKDQGDLSFKFTGDVSEADESIRALMDRLEALKDTASETEKQFLDNVIGSASKLLKKNDEILKANQDNYKTYLEKSLYDDGFGDELAEYSKRTQEYNDALLSGDASKINEAKQQLDDYKGTVAEITSAHEEYGDFFDEVANSVDKTTEKVYQFKDIIEDGVAESTNDLSEYSDQIFRTVNDIKKLGLDGVDIQAILGNPQDAMYADLSQLAKLWNPDIDLSNKDDLQAFTDFLAQLGSTAGSTGGQIDLAKDDFDSFIKTASASIDTIDKVNGALVNSFKSGGLSARIDAETGELTGDVQTILSAYKKELGDGSIDQLFERTANGVIVNRDALRALQAEQENTTKAEFIKRIKEAETHLSAATTDSERQAWQTRLDNVKLLASAYDGATSAYQKWVDAQSMGEAGDQYDTIASTALKRGEELYDKGLVGTNEFRAIAQLYSDQDLALASVEEVTEAYENGVDTVKKYFTEGQEGAVAFADKLVELGAATKEGDFYNFEDGIDTSKIADELDISVDLVEAAFKKLGDYGFDIHFLSEDQLAEFDSLTEKAEEAQDKLKELRDSGAEVGDSKLIDIDLSEIDTIDETKSALEQLNEVVASPDIDPESAEAYQAIIDALQEKLDLLSQTDIGNEVNFDNLDSAYTLLGSLQGRMNQIDSLNATSTVDIDVTGDDKVQLVAEQIANLPPDIKTAIGFDVEDDATDVIEKLKSEKVQIPVEYQQPTNTPSATGGTATVSVQYEQGDLPTVSAQTVHLDYEPNPINANVVAVLNKTAVDSYKPEDKNATVHFDKDSSSPDSYQPSDKYATVNYSVSVSGASAVDNLPDSGDRYITYHINTVGSAPGNYKGTVSRSAFQGMSHARGTAHANGLSRFGLKQDENSLVNELGAEIVVRPSEDSWMIFNDGMPTFAQLRKGDVIFSADQSKELLEKGWTKNYASILGGAFARGTVKGAAHARKVVGGGRFKKATSTSKSSGGNGNGGGGGNGGSNDGNSNSKSNKEAKDFKETLDKIEILIDRIERKISNLDTIASNTFNDWTTRNRALKNSLISVRKEIEYQEKGYKRYLKQANKVGLDPKLAKKVRNGEIGIQDVKDEDTWKKIEEYRKWYEAALDARDAVYKLKVDEADLWNQRFELNQTNYENRIAQYQHIYDQMDSYIELAENTGRISANKYRTKQIDEENKKMTKLREEYDNIKGTMKSALESGKITINSEGYFEMLNTLNKVREDIVATRVNIKQLNNEIRETNWEIFDRGAESISKINDELEFLYGLLGDEDKMFSDKGIVNNDGITGFGILSAQYNVAMKESQKYASEIAKINKSIANDPYNQDLIERRQELYESQRKAIESANKYKDSIVDLVEVGIKKQIDSLKDLISNYTDLMDAQKDEIDYAKKVSDAQSNINKLQKQLNAYANDDTEEGAFRRQKLRNDLKNAQDNLAQTEEERRISQTKKLLSDLQDEYENILNARLDDVNALIQAVVDGVDANANTIKASIETATADVGYTLTSEVSTIFENATKPSVDLVSYFTNGDFVNKVTSISTAVSNIEQYYKDAVTNANNVAKTNMSYANDTQAKTNATMAAAAAKGTKAKNAENKVSGVNGKWVKDKKGNRVAWQFNDGTKATGLSKIDNKWYLFDDKGKMKLGLHDYGGSKYYWTRDSGKAVSKWVQVNKKWYYFDKNGKAVKGWQKLKKDKKSGWFFFNDNNQMATNSWIHAGKITKSPKKGDFYVGSDGISVKGKIKIGKSYRTFGTDRKWKGYKSGIKSVGSDGLYWTNEGAPETIIRKSDGAVLTKLNTGDTVINNDATQNMWDFANNPQKFLRGLGVSNTYGSGNNVSLEFNLSGLRSPSEFMDALRKDKRFEKLIQEMTLGRVNGHGSLAKNAIRI